MRRQDRAPTGEPSRLFEGLYRLGQRYGPELACLVEAYVKAFGADWRLIKLESDARLEDELGEWRS